MYIVLLATTMLHLPYSNVMHHDDIKTYIIELGFKILLTQNQHLFFCEFLCSSIAMLKLMWIFVTQSFKYDYTWCLRVDTCTVNTPCIGKLRKTWKQCGNAKETKSTKICIIMVLVDRNCILCPCSLVVLLEYKKCTQTL